MNLPEISIRRHVFAFMLNAVLILFGFIAYQRIGVDKLPYIEFPVISVSTTQRGANPEVIDAAITNVIETAVNSVPGIEHIQSTSSPGTSTVSITFDLAKPIDVAFQEVQAKVNQVLRRLPDDADPPVVAKVETNTSPIFWMALQGDRTQQQLNQYAVNIIKKRLETIDGVGEVRIGGRRDRTIRVNLVPARMAAFGIAAQDITDGFRKEHIQFSGGFLTGRSTEHLVKLDLEFHKLDELAAMIVGYKDGAPVRLRDIAEIEDGLNDFRQMARANGKPTVGIGIVKVPNTNTVAIIETVQARMRDEIQPQLPPGLELNVIQNDALFIDEMVQSLKSHLVEGTLLAALIVWLFLKSFRSTLIIATSIPVSLFGAIAVMYFFGYTFNSVTLLALLLLIGVVVDDAIVVLENIFRHREHIEPDRVKAAVSGSAEVTFAVIAASFALAAIFAPVIFVSGILGQFLRSFAVVVTFGVLVSLFVSLTLTPMLCSRFLEVREQHGRIYWALERFFRGMEGTYRASLGWALRNRVIVLVAALAATLSSVFFFRALPVELAPTQDEGKFFISMRAPAGSSIHYMERKLRRGGAARFALPGSRHGVRRDRLGLGRAGQPGHRGGAHEAALRAASLAAAGDRPACGATSPRSAACARSRARRASCRASAPSRSSSWCAGRTSRRWGGSPRHCRSGCRRIPRSAAWTPTCSSTCRSSSSSPTVCAPPPSVLRRRTWRSRSTCSPAASTSPSTTTSRATANATTCASRQRRASSSSRRISRRSICATRAASWCAWTTWRASARRSGRR